MFSSPPRLDLKRHLWSMKQCHNIWKIILFTLHISVLEFVCCSCNDYRYFMQTFSLPKNSRIKVLFCHSIKQSLDSIRKKILKLSKLTAGFQLLNFKLFEIFIFSFNFILLFIWLPNSDRWAEICYKNTIHWH